MLVAEAKSFTLALYGLRASPSLGKGKLAIVKQALEAVPVVPTGLFVASGWMGSSSSQTLVLWATFNKETRMRMLSLRTPWEALGWWEDLALFDDGHVTFWSTSHESEAFALADEGRMKSLGLQAGPCHGLAANLTPVDEEVLASLGIQAV